MNALFDMRDTIQKREGSPLTVWLKRHGARTVAKYNELLKAGGIGPITFQAETPSKIFEAFIDPENKFAQVDKFSQVCCFCFLRTFITPIYSVFVRPLQNFSSWKQFQLDWALQRSTVFKCL